MCVEERLREILDESLSMGLVLKSIHEQLRMGYETEHLIKSEGLHYLLRGILNPIPHVILLALLQ